jgi:predicted anti-sigma-YlaC factor YlaD
MDCIEFRHQLDAYLEETMEEERRPDVRRHLRECSSCSTWARSVEPSLIFVTAQPVPVDLARIEACAAAVTGQIRQQRLAGRLRGHRRSWLAAAAACALALIGAGVWQMLPDGGGAMPALSRDAGTAAEIGAAPPTVEVEMPGDDVRVYHFANDEDNDTAVYFIVNPGLEL